MTTSFSNIIDAVNTTFLVITVISVVFLALITVLMVAFVIKYRRKRHPEASQIEGNTFLEVAWTVIPTLLVLGMFYYGWVGYRLMRNPPAGAMEVTAIAQMWSWQFRYTNGKQSSELYVPVDQPVKVNLESRDVLHSFYVPAFKVKQDVVPGSTNFLWFESEELGTFDIFCAEYCGERHAYMLSKVVVVAQDEFDQWVETGVEDIQDVSGEELDEDALVVRLQRTGERLSQVKGCNACHTVDGTALVGPTYKGLFGKTETVVTDGETRQIVVDEDYVRNSILNPNADVVEGFQPLMPSQEGMITDEEITAIIEYLKTLQ
jgi:cytochrome c oxidase subunit 2